MSPRRNPFLVDSKSAEVVTVRVDRSPPRVDRDLDRAVLAPTV